MTSDWLLCFNDTAEMVPTPPDPMTNTFGLPIICLDS